MRSEKETAGTLKLAERGAQVSIASYLFLTVMKLVTGTLYGSSSLVADGMNNLTDVISSVAVLVGLKKAQVPADDDHRYGHWKAESIASLITSFIMFLVAFEIFISAGKKIFSHTTEAPSLSAAVVALLGSAIIYGVHLFNKRLAKKARSGGLQAVAQDNLADALTGLATAGAVVASALGWAWLDVLMAMVVGLIVLNSAWEIFRDNVFDLSDGFDEEKLADYKRAIGALPGVLSVKTMRGRMYGNREFLDVTVIVDGQMRVKVAHDLTDEIECMLQEEYQVAHTHIHVEPDHLSEN